MDQAARPPARLSRRRLVLGVVVAAVVFAACVPVEQLPPEAASYCAPAPPTTAAGYQQAFDGLRTVWTEWAAADGGLPTALPDGRVLWTFGDTLVGRVRSDGSVAAPSSWLRNSFVVQTGACFAPLMGGTRGARSEILPNPAGNEWYWPSDAVVEDGGTHLRVFSLHLRKDPNGSGGFDFIVLGTSMSTFSLPDLTLLGTEPVPVATSPPSNPLYGQTVLTDGTYLYAYGPKELPKDPTFPGKEHRLARVPLGQETTGTWEFALLDNAGVLTGWTPTAALATPMHFTGGSSFNDPNGPRAPLAVIPDPGGAGYLASGMPLDGFAGQVDTWAAPNPWGPWTHVGTAVSGLPTAFGTTWAYGGRVVDISGSARMVLWSQNHNPVSDIVANNAWYKVGFAPA